MENKRYNACMHVNGSTFVTEQSNNLTNLYVSCRNHLQAVTTQSYLNRSTCEIFDYKLRTVVLAFEVVYYGKSCKNYGFRTRRIPL